jgi:hypothetical protein
MIQCEDFPAVVPKKYLSPEPPTENLRWGPKTIYFFFESRCLIGGP